MGRLRPRNPPWEGCGYIFFSGMTGILQVTIISENYKLVTCSLSVGSFEVSN